MIRVINSEMYLPVTRSRQRRWDIVIFLLSGSDLFPILLFSQEEPPLSFLEIWVKNAIAAFFEDTICDSFCTS
jgi:hypothetical protein